MNIFFEIMAWLCTASCLSCSIVGLRYAIDRDRDNEHRTYIRSAAWAIAAALFFIVPRLPS